MANSKTVYYPVKHDQRNNEFISIEKEGKIGVCLSLVGLKKFIYDHFPKGYNTFYYVTVSLDNFEYDNDLYSDKYDMIPVKTPFKIELKDIKKLSENN